MKGGMIMKKIKIIAICALALALSGCSKYGVSGSIDHAMGDWAQVKLPEGCVAKQIAVEENSGVAVLCEDGRVFH